jgi:hypothetical protein
MHGRRVHRTYVLGGHVLSYLSDLTTLADRNALHLSTNERLLKVVRVDCDDGQRLVGLQVPKLVLDIWQSELQQGTMVVSRGLGVSAGSEPSNTGHSVVAYVTHAVIMHNRLVII